MKRALAVVIGTIMAAAASPAQEGDGPFARVRAAIRQQMTDRQIPSVAVAVARNGRIIWEEAFGWADRENLVPATPDTMYSLASISKSFTGTALMILKERGKVVLDRPINDYLGDAKIKVRLGNPADLTVRRVANHTSGLPLHYQFFYEDEPYRVPSRDETILRYGNTITAPGEKYQYSNLGYGILDYVITRVSGRAYAEFMRTEVFLPLGMTHSSIGIGPGLGKQHAIRYGTDGLPIPFYDFDHPGASAVYASAHDLVRYGMFHMKAHLSDQKSILSDESIDEMQRPTTPAEENWSYGIGFRSGLHSSGHRVVWHTGGMGGVSTLLCMLPEDKVAFVVLVNAAAPLTNIVRDEIIATLFPEAPRAPIAPARTPQSNVFKPSQQLAGTWKGTVHTFKEDIPVTLEIKADGDIHAQLGEQMKALVNRTDFRDGYLSGQMIGDIRTEDANRTSYVLSLSLKLRDGELNGGVTAQSVPAKRPGNALTYWAELKKQ
jgi:CubicO group peptidase (beta-lactamase class C family)